MALDDQAAAFGLLGGDDGLVDAVQPALLGADTEAFVGQGFGQGFKIGLVIVLFLADQQVQMALGHASNQLGTVDGQPVWLMGLDDYQNAANGLHDHLPGGVYN